MNASNHEASTRRSPLGPRPKPRTAPRSLLRCATLLAALGLASCGGDVGIGVSWYSDHYHPWPDHPDWPSWPDKPQGATGLFPIAGDICGTCTTTRDGTGSAARFAAPEGIAADKAGNLYVAEPKSATIRKVSPQGVTTTLAGTPGAVGYADGTGGAARFNQPSRLEADANGNVYVTDTGNSAVRRVTAAGEVGTVAGNGTCGSVDGRDTSAQFCNPKGIALDRQGNLWVADTGNHTVRRIDVNGNVTTVAGSPGVCGSADGRGDRARLCNPGDIDVDEWNNVYVVDTGNSTIRMINPKGEVSTLAGQAGQCGAVEGSPSVSRLCAPGGIAIEGNDLYIADTDNATIRRINLDNVTSTVAGVAGSQQIKLGALPGSLDHPAGIARVPDGSFAITTHNMVVKLLPAK
jgi:sugar lactone lactonase YvrE